MSPATARAEAPVAADPSLRVVPLRDTRDLGVFIRLPGRLYRGQRGYVAPLAYERRRTLSPDRNPYFQHAAAQYWLAWRGERPVGRISAQVDRAYLARYGNATGHFGFLDSADDPAVFLALTAAAEDWLRQRGLRRALGPFSLSINEESGLLVEGFDAPAMFMMGFAPPYAGRRLAELGYRKAKDLLAYEYDLTSAPALDGASLLERVGHGQRVGLRRLDRSRYDADLRVILDIFNDAWCENWGFVPFTEAEMAQIAHDLRPLIQREMVWIAEVDGVPAAMIVCLPNLCEALAGLDGRLLPWGWLKLLWRLKVSGLRSSRVPLMGLRRRYHGSPLGTALVLLVVEAARQSMIRLGFARAELSWILEDNWPARRLAEGIGARPYKTYRLYEKLLG